MQRRNLRLVRAGMAHAAFLGLAAWVVPALADPPSPLPGKAEANTETVSILAGQKTGLIRVETRGHGEGRVKITIKNLGQKRLNVVIPPGLVAANLMGQAGAGGGGAGGFGGGQSMGLGSITNQPGAFGHFNESAHDKNSGLASVPPAPESNEPNTVAVPVGRSVALNVSAVCLNFGDPTPTSQHVFRLVDVDDYTTNVRARKALRSLANIGASLGVAQAVAWHTFNNMSFDAIAEQAPGFGYINVYEVELGARFVEALDRAGDSEMFDPTPLLQSRLFVQVRGAGEMKAKAAELAEKLEGRSMFGLKVNTYSEGSAAHGPALLLTITLSSAGQGAPVGSAAIKSMRYSGSVNRLGEVKLNDLPDASLLTPEALAKCVERAVTARLVSARTAKNLQTSSLVQISNSLPFTIASVVVKAGESESAARITVPGLGIGPKRKMLVPIEAPNAVVEKVVFNGL